MTNVPRSVSVTRGLKGAPLSTGPEYGILSEQYLLTLRFLIYICMLIWIFRACKGSKFGYMIDISNISKVNRLRNLHSHLSTDGLPSYSAP